MMLASITRDSNNHTCIHYRKMTPNDSECT